MNRKTLAAAILGSALILSGCSQATADRTSGAGKSVDSAEDTWNVKVFNNADNVPNTALFCINRADPIAILSTLSGGDGGKDKAAQVVKMPELNASYCGGRAQ